jgi:hypothetical protein
MATTGWLCVEHREERSHVGTASLPIAGRRERRHGRPEMDGQQQQRQPRERLQRGAGGRHRLHRGVFRAHLAASAGLGRARSDDREASDGVARGDRHGQRRVAGWIGRLVHRRHVHRRGRRLADQPGSRPGGQERLGVGPPGDRHGRRPGALGHDPVRRRRIRRRRRSAARPTGRAGHHARHQPGDRLEPRCQLERPGPYGLRDDRLRRGRLHHHRRSEPRPPGRPGHHARHQPGDRLGPRRRRRRHRPAPVRHDPLRGRHVHHDRRPEPPPPGCARHDARYQPGQRVGSGC